MMLNRQPEVRMRTGMGRRIAGGVPPCVSFRLHTRVRVLRRAMALPPAPQERR